MEFGEPPVLRPNCVEFPEESARTGGLRSKDDRLEKYFHEVDLLMDEIRGVRARMQRQRPDVETSRCSSRGSLGGDEPYQNWGRRGLSDGSLEAGGRHPRPQTSDSLGIVMSDPGRGATRCPPTTTRDVLSSSASSGVRHGATRANDSCQGVEPVAAIGSQLKQD